MSIFCNITLLIIWHDLLSVAIIFNLIVLLDHFVSFAFNICIIYLSNFNIIEINHFLKLKNFFKILLIIRLLYSLLFAFLVKNYYPQHTILDIYLGIVLFFNFAFHIEYFYNRRFCRNFQNNNNNNNNISQV